MMTTLSSIAQRLRPKVKRVPDLYRTCSEIPLAVFLACTDDPALDGLHKAGSVKASPEALRAAWDDIFTEYIDIMQNPEQMHQLSLMKDITKLESELSLSGSLILFLSLAYSAEAENSLRKMGFRLTLKKGDQDHNREQLEKVVRQRKSRILALSQKRAELDQYLEKQKKATKSDSGDMFSVLSELSSFQGYRLDPNTVTVAEYVAISKRFKKHVEASKKAKKWKK